ncbi:MAG: GNAT family N-acetyltransferase [Nitrososphaerota archaeon]|nr:GNAT family N-acetyltransferase [Nitrososphaerota archaeon]
MSMEVRIRPARISDRAPLMSFIKHVWGGHDYIPRVWDYWIRDAESKMFVVVADGVPVGMNRVRFMEDGSAWFEGARVHPAFRGQGLASMLGENSMRLAKGRGATTFRLASGSRNHTAHRQIARIGFKEVARFSVYDPPRRRRGKGSPETLRRDQSREALKLIRGSTEYRLGHGVFWHNFGAASLTPEVVGVLAREGAVKRLGRAVAVVRTGGVGPGLWEEVGFIGGPPGDAVELARAVTGRKEATERWVFLPQGSPIIGALREAGFKRSHSNILFERMAAKG